MKFTIITATYNSSKTVRDTLQSVANQKFSSIEHIIIDGESKDDTLKTVSEFPHVSKVLSEPDHGIYDAMNKGIDVATGDIIGILNADDYYTNNEVVSDVIKVFKSQEDIDCVYADLEFVASDNIEKVVRTWKSGVYRNGDFFYGWMPPHPTFFVKKKLYNQFGKFNPNLGTAADYELMLRFIHKNNCKVAYLPKTIVTMRTGGASSESIYARIKANRMDKKAWEINGLNPKYYTFIMKPLRKLLQYKWLSKFILNFNSFKLADKLLKIIENIIKK